MTFQFATFRSLALSAMIPLLFACGDDDPAPDDAVPGLDGAPDAIETPSCGDGRVAPGEACDDGNDLDTDACTSACELAACGDGHLQVGVEACDDGNDLDTDACTSACALAACGDGHLQTGVEACDDGNDLDTDACTNACALAACGDGHLQTGVEACDDGNDLDTDACTSGCELAACGDGFVQVGVEACDDGNTAGLDACSADCACASPGGIDADGDGFTPGQGDCDDCDPNVNPGAVEVVAPSGAPRDEDCDGAVDEDDEAPCDAGLALGDLDPLDGAHALGLCRVAATGSDWGIVSASYVRASGLPASVGAGAGLLADFGPTSPLQGDRMLGLSSGAARDAGDPGYCAADCASLGAGTPPPGFPESPYSCSSSEFINDDVGLEVTLRAPTNATGFRVRYRVYMLSVSEYICTSYNDQFVILASPPPPGSANGNIAFDVDGDPLSLNHALFTYCDASETYAMYCYGTCPSAPPWHCAFGTAQLAGTGFEAGGATDWLLGSAPVEAGATFTLRFAIWDTGDNREDSTVLIDGFEWIATPGS